MFTKLRDFLATGVQALTAGGNKTHFLFATYNKVSGYDSGNVHTGKEGLTIQVQNGNLRYSQLSLLALLSPLPTDWGVGHDMMYEEGRKAQSVVEADLKVETQEGAQFIAVIYAGMSAFDEAVVMARKIKQDHPTARIVITTCDCTMDGHKHRILDPMLETREIETVVENYDCGGRDMMRSVLRGVIEAWPVKVPA